MRKNYLRMKRKVEFCRGFGFYLILFSLPVPAVLLFVSVMLCSCTEVFPQKPVYEAAFVPGLVENQEIVDVFIYNDDALKRLDAYQRTVRTYELPLFSQNGDRIFCLYANPKTDGYTWYDINSFEALEEQRVDIEDENRNAVVSTAICRLLAGTRGKVCLTPLLAEVRLRSLSVDFKGRFYQGEDLKNLKVYLINVSAESRLFAERPFMPTRIINMGGLNESDMRKMKDGSLLYRELGQLNDGSKVYPDVRLYCYPNGCVEESPGSVHTRLVIEAEIEGGMYYYSVNVGGPSGVERACSYVYDLKITKKGSTDPDVVCEVDEVEFVCEVSKWKEKEEYVLGF